MTLLEIIKQHGFDEKYFQSKGIKLKIEYPYALFMYTLGECTFDEKWQKECRGHIVDMETLEFVCRPFDKFFNYGETYADTLDFKNKIIVREKLDGSLIKVWFSERLNQYIISTNGVIYAKTAYVGHTNKTFEELFLKAFKDTQNEEFNERYFDKNYTYMFELCTPENKVVISHDKYEIYFLSKRNNKNGNEIYTDNNFKLSPHLWEISTLQDALKLINKFNEENNEEEEGIVITDINQKKVKIKTEVYLKKFYSIDLEEKAKSIKWLFNNTKERSELISYNQNLQAYFNHYDNIYNSVIENMKKEIEYFSTFTFSNKKELSENIYLFKNSSLIYKIYDGYTLNDFIEKRLSKFNYFDNCISLYDIDTTFREE